MTGYCAALIVQAEEHLIKARSELYLAMDRLRDLERRVSPDTAKHLETIRIAIQEKINGLEIECFQDYLHHLGHAEP